MNANESSRPISPLPESHDQDTVSELQQYLNEATLVYQDATAALTTLRSQPDPATELEDVKCSETLAELRGLVGDVRRLRPSQVASSVPDEVAEPVSGAMDASTRADLDNRAIEAAVGEENKRLLILQRVLSDRDRFFGDRARTIIYSEDDLIPLTTEDAIFDHGELMASIIEKLGNAELVSPDVQTTVCTTYRISAGTCQMIVNDRALFGEAAINRIVAARELAQAESGRAGVQLDNRIVDRAMQDIEGQIQSYRTQAREVLTTKREGVQNTLRKRISSEAAISATGIKVDEFYAYGNRSIEETTESLLAGEVQDEIRESQESHATDLAKRGLVDVPRIVRKYQMGVDAPRILGGAVRLLEGRVTSLHERFERNRQEAVAEMRVAISVLTDVDLDDVSVERATQALNDPDEIFAISSTVARAAGNVAGQRSLRHPFGSGQSLNEQHIAQLKLLNTHIDRCGAWGNKLQAAIREYDARLDALESEVPAVTSPLPLVPAPAIPSAPNGANSGAPLTTPVPVASETSPGVSDTIASPVPLRPPVAPPLPQPPLETPSQGDGPTPDGGDGSAASEAPVSVERGELLAIHRFNYVRAEENPKENYDDAQEVNGGPGGYRGEFGAARNDKEYAEVWLFDKSDIRTVTMQLWPKGREAEQTASPDGPSRQMEVGSEFDLEGKSLTMHVEVLACTYIENDPTKFKTFTIEAKVYNKPESETDTSTPTRAAAPPADITPAAVAGAGDGPPIEVGTTDASIDVDKLVGQEKGEELYNLAIGTTTDRTIALRSLKELIRYSNPLHVENVVLESTTQEDVRAAAIAELIRIGDWNFFSSVAQSGEWGEPLAMRALALLIEHGQYDQVTEVSEHAVDNAVKQRAVEALREKAKADAQKKIETALAGLPPEIRDVVRGSITELHAIAMEVRGDQEKLADAIFNLTTKNRIPILSQALGAYAHALSAIVHMTDGSLNVTPETLRLAGAEMVRAALSDIKAGAELLTFLNIEGQALLAGDVGQITGETLTRAIIRRVIAHEGLNENIRALLRALLKDPDAVQAIGADSRINEKVGLLKEPAEAEAAQAKAERGAKRISEILNSDIPIGNWTVEQVAKLGPNIAGAREIMDALGLKSKKYEKPLITLIQKIKDYYDKGLIS